MINSCFFALKMKTSGFHSLAIFRNSKFVLLDQICVVVQTNIYKREKMILGVFQVLSSLPTCLSCAVLCEWLAQKSICRLDTALCERSKRTVFLSLLQSDEYVGKIRISSRYKQEFIWINRRSVKLSDLYLSADEISSVLCEEYLQRFGPYVRSLQMGSPSNGALQLVVAQFCHNLAQLYVYSSSKFSLECLEVVKANSNLVELIMCCALDVTSLSTTKLPMLKYLCFLQDEYNDPTFICLVKLSQQLVFLSLHCSGITSDGLIQAAPFCTRLQFFLSSDLLDIDYALQEMTQICKHIQHIDLSSCLSLTDAGIIAVAKNVHGLRSIHFTYSHSITNVCLVHLAEHQHRTLEIFSVIKGLRVSEPVRVKNRQTFNTAAVTAFRAKCKKLRVFNWKLVVTWDTIHAIPIIISSVASAYTVTTLDLMYVNDAVLHAIALNCKQLEVLFLYYCSTVELCSDNMILEVAKKCTTLRSLVVLESQVSRFLNLLSAYTNIQVLSDSDCAYLYRISAIYRSSSPGNSLVDAHLA